ncbi:MAG: hypothetical protein M3Y50_16635 [Acidobacteriota bacterium]|nr:hypothetical protein [Acidobacteriota bacterium]
MSGGDPAPRPIPAPGPAGLPAPSEEIADLGSTELKPSAAYETVPYDPRPQQENVRGIIALFLVGLLAATIAAAFVMLWLHPDRSRELHDLLALTFGPLVALVGAATGYYFGSRAAEKS